MSIYAIIPARGGSKGIPRKNVRPLAGRPLIEHSIADAREAQCVQRVFVSTDDEEIAQVALAAGAEVLRRPAELATDTASSEAALLHALDCWEGSGVVPELMVFLQCTSPIRTGLDIDRAVEQFRAEGADSLLSVSPAHKFLWENTPSGARSINYDFRARPRRQDMAPQYAENGSLYVIKPALLRQSGNRLSGRISLFVMSEEAAIDIDSEVDFLVADVVLSNLPVTAR